LYESAKAKEVKSMAFRLKAVILITSLSSLAAFAADWFWGP
jgi:hypothetical protein